MLAAAPAAALGLAVPALRGAGLIGLVALGLAFGLAAAAARSIGPAVVVVAIACAVAGALWSQHVLADLRADPLARQQGAQHQVRVTVVAEPRSTPGGFASRARLAGHPVELLSRIAPEQGDVLLVDGHLAAVPPSRPGRFDRRTWLARQGVHELLRAERTTTAGRRGGIAGLADSIRREARRALGADRDDQATQVVAGVVLGSTAGLSDRTVAQFRASGLAHLLAVSGGNVAILVGSLLAIAWLARLPVTAGHAAAIVAVIAYALVVGTGPSVVRAAVAGVLTSLAWILRHPRDRWHVLAVGAALVQALDPFAVVGPGFQLSFAAVWAIYVVAPRIRRFLDGRPCPAWLREPIALSLACSLATAPISWWHFGRTSLIAGLPANVFALAAVAPLLWLGLSAIALQPLLPHAASLIAAGARALGAYLLVVASLGTQLGEALPGTSSSAGTARALRVTVLDVGEGSAALVEAPGLTALIDTGRAEANVASLLERRGIHHLDLVLVSHDQADHAGGAPAVRARLTVDRFVTGATRGLAITRGAVTLRVLGPEHVDPNADPNLSATVLEARQGACSILLPADAESDRILLDSPPSETVLVVAHHGSRDERLPELLARIRPRLAVISVGPNSYGHPAARTVAALAAAGVPVKRTDLDGDVTVQC